MRGAWAFGDNLTSLLSSCGKVTSWQKPLVLKLARNCPSFIGLRTQGWPLQGYLGLTSPAQSMAQRMEQAAIAPALCRFGDAGLPPRLRHFSLYLQVVLTDCIFQMGFLAAYAAIFCP